MASHGPSASSLLALHHCLGPSAPSPCLPFTFAWSIAAEPCLPFTILPYKTSLYHASSMNSLSHFDRHGCWSPTQHILPSWLFTTMMSFITLSSYSSFWSLSRSFNLPFHRVNSFINSWCSFQPYSPIFDPQPMKNQPFHLDAGTQPNTPSHGK